jgi:hypothetical protein
MIHFLTTRQNQHPIRRYLEGHGAALAQRIKPALYDWLLAEQALPPGAYLFADLELLPEHERQEAERIWNRLAARGCPLLNHPTRSLRRYDLLRLLHARGVNQFNLYRLGESETPPRFPVFVRGENDHHGSRTRLLESTRELAAAATWLKWTSWFGKKRLREAIVTEFCDTADEEGVYRKYSAFNVRGEILPRHVFFSDRWMVKSWKLAEKKFRLEEEAYIQANPHAEQLCAIFAAARIDYGRIDYSLLGGRVQVWEINTNPMIVGTGRGGNGARAAIHDDFARRIEACFERFDAASSVAA